MGEFYRIPCDNRSLNYDEYFDKGNFDISQIDDYNSHNTRILNLEEVKSLLQKLPLFN